MRTRLVGIIAAFAAAAGLGASTAAASSSTAGVGAGAAAGSVSVQVLTFKDQYTWQPWHFTGVFSASAHTFVGTAVGRFPTQDWYSGWNGGTVPIPTFVVKSTGGHGSLSGSCSGSLSGGNEADIACVLSVGGARAVAMQLTATLTNDNVANPCDATGGCTNDYVGPFRSG